MAKLNLNFHKQTGRHNPTEHELDQVVGVALSVEGIIKALEDYAYGKHEDTESVCINVCYALELLIEPVIDYLSNYAGEEPEPDEAEVTASGSE